MTKLKQSVYHRMLLWRGDPVYITPAKRVELEQAWTNGESGDAIDVAGTMTQIGNIAGFQETNEQLPADLLPAAPAGTKQLGEEKAVMPIDPKLPTGVEKFDADFEWVKFRCPRPFQSYWRRQKQYVVLAEYVAYCRPAGHELEPHLTKCTSKDMEAIKDAVQGEKAV